MLDDGSSQPCSMSPHEFIGTARRVDVGEGVGRTDGHDPPAPVSVVALNLAQGGNGGARADPPVPSIKGWYTTPSCGSGSVIWSPTRPASGGAGGLRHAHQDAPLEGPVRRIVRRGGDLRLVPPPTRAVRRRFAALGSSEVGVPAASRGSEGRSASPRASAAGGCSEPGWNRVASNTTTSAKAASATSVRSFRADG